MTGFNVEPVHEELGEDDGTEYCTAKEDLADAQAVADQLGIPSMLQTSRQNIGMMF